MAHEQYWTQKLEQAEAVILQEIRAEQVTHPIDLYQPGSEHLEKLYAAMDAAARFQWPRIYVVNL